MKNKNTSTYIIKTKSVIWSVCLILLCFHPIQSQAETVVTIDDPATWKPSDLNAYRGQTIRFTTPFYVCNNYYNGRLIISPRRIFSPTNQALPLSNEYNAIIRANENGTIALTNFKNYHRNGEIISNLVVYVNSTSSLSYVSGTFGVNTRADMERGIPDVDMAGEHSLLVCSFNLQYYLVENLGTGYGPSNTSESNQQHTKIMDALKRINADVFGFLEIEQGQSAIEKLAKSLTTATGRHYDYINDGTSPYSSYTKSGYVYCSDKVEPVGNLKNNNTCVVHRKKMQAFREKSSGETFIFSINHFKAKSGTGTGDNADQGDGQGIFNADRVQEAESVLDAYNTNKAYYGDEDVLIMGDLNAYAKEDPIRVFTDNGMTDLHRAFHADSSYSYVFHGEAGYLDHAIANSTMLSQVTGMAAYHINSDESNSYSYSNSNDYTMFRCSDHDPILVGLALGQSIEMKTNCAEKCSVELRNGKPYIHYAAGGYYKVYTISGQLLYEGKILNKDEETDCHLNEGFYIINVYVENTVKQFKFLIVA